MWSRFVILICITRESKPYMEDKVEWRLHFSFVSVCRFYKLHLLSLNVQIYVAMIHNLRLFSSSEKYLVLFMVFTFAILQGLNAQKKPTVMILPSDHWCEMRYYMTAYDNQGQQIKIPDYRKAFLEDVELGPVVGKIGEILTKMGYSLKDAEQELKNINVKQAEDNVTQSKTSGAMLAENPLDVLKRRIKSDILIQISWDLSKTGLGHATTFTLEAFDSYTSKRIATSIGTTNGQGLVSDLLVDAVQENVKEFDKQLDNWFKDQKKNGREISLIIRCWDNWTNNLETEYNGEELTDCIQDWLRQNCVNETFNLSDGTETFLQFEQVRIPLLDDKGNAQDARGFATMLRKYLAKSPFNITSKVMQRGLGEAILVLGEK